MNNKEVAGRVLAFGGRWQTRVRRFFDAPLGPDARPLEIREALLDAIEGEVTPLGGGRRVLPWAGLAARIVAPAGTRAACEATFRDFDARLRARLAEIRCEAPAALEARVEVLESAPADWDTGRLFAIDYDPLPDPAAPPTAAPPALTITILAGTATQPAFATTVDTVLVGRGVEPVDSDGRVRRNHVAFLDDAGDVADTVGRAHARFAWDEGSGAWRLFDEGSSNGTHVIRNGTTVPVPRRDPRGVRVRTGDEIQFGRARVRIEVGAGREVT
jgi:hypothetical protein